MYQYIFQASVQRILKSQVTGPCFVSLTEVNAVRMRLTSLAKPAEHYPTRNLANGALHYFL